MVRVVWVGGGLLAVSMGCSALSLGAAQGQALIGRPLDVSIPLTLGDGESVTDACASAQVFFADDAVSAAGVKTSVLGGAQPSVVTVRVQTAAPVTETFARIELQVGCGQRVTRSYVLLADLAPTATPAAPLMGGAIKPVLSSVPVPAAVATVRASGVSGSSATAAPPDRPAKSPAAPPSPRKVPNASAGPSGAPTKTAASVPAAQGSRLTLDPLELVAAANQMQPSLRLSVDAPVESVENADLAQRRQAARLLWKALNDSPDQLAANALKAEVTGAESSRIKAELAEAQQLAQAAQAQLLEEQDSRYTNPVFLGVLAALVAALGGLVSVLRRQRHGGGADAPAWWKNQPARPVADSTLNDSPSATKPSFLARFKSLATQPRKALRGEPTLDIDVDTLMPEDAWPVAPAAVPAAATPAPREAGPSQSNSDFTHSALFEGARSVTTEELFDLQQQVEFFISLDQADQAIEVLKAHLSDSGDTSPLAYLDLLKLYHETGRREDYAALQAHFNNTFNGNAPDFDRYSISRRGLERYESALSRIQSLWPQPEVLQLIERSIFRSVPGDTSEVFDLEAYRELLLLYGIARDVIEGQAADSRMPAAVGAALLSAENAARDSGETAMQPLPMTMASASALVVAAPLDVPSPTLDVDERAPDEEGPTLASVDAVNPMDAFKSVGLDLDLDLDLSLSDTLPAEASIPSPAEPAAVLPQVSDAHVLDLDFSELGEPEAFTIKKSGKPS